MKKNVLSVALLMMSGFAFAQVGIGTKNPNSSALLDIEAQIGDFKGILIPRVPLVTVESNAVINGSKTPNSLLVFNTTDNKELKPGYYFWFGSRWVRLLSSTDDLVGQIAVNEELAVNLEEEILFLRDTKNNIVTVPLTDLNFVTSLSNTGQGKYTYISEDKTETVIDVVADVISNINQIFNEESVITEIINSISANEKALSGDGIIEVVGGEKAVLTPTSLHIKEGSITPSKIHPGASKQLLITDAIGTVKWVDASDEVIKEIVEHNEVVTLLVDGQDGTFTYYNEKDIDANGQFIPGRGVKFDANTLRIEKTDDNTYEFYDKTSSTTPIAVIDVVGSVIENISEILNDTTVQNDIYNTVAAQGKAAAALDGSIKIENGSQAVLNEMQLSVANQGITPAKIQPGGNKQLLVTDENGAVKWVDASDEIIKEVVEQNEVITLIVDGGDGTFTYYNEKGIDADGNFIPGQGVKFDANTLQIEERPGSQGKGIFDFYDGMTSLASPLMTINTRAKAIVFENNSTTIQGDNLQEVIDNIIQKVEIAQGSTSPLKGDGILINGQVEVANSVLKDMTLSLADNAVTEAKILDGQVTSHKIKNQAVTLSKIEPGTNKYILVTKGGTAQWVPATDSIIKDVVEQNEVVTLIEDNANGTYSYYNEKAIDASGNPIKAQEILIDANTLSITKETNGTYVFRDGTFNETATPLAVIDIEGTVIENIDTILSNIEVQNNIYATVAAKGKAATAADGSIKIDNGDQAVLNEMQLSVANQGITPAKIQPGANKHLLVTKDGIVQWVPVSDEVIGEVVEYNEKVTILDISANNGTFVYYNEEDIDQEGTIIGTGVLFDANTLKIEEKTGEKGVYVFYDGKTSVTTPLMTIDVLGTVINNISDILNDTTVQNDIYNTVAAKGKPVTSPDSSIAVGGNAVNAALNDIQLTIANDGVKTAAIASQAVTTAKILGGQKGQLLVTTAPGVAQWMSASDDPIKEILALNQAVTELIDNQDGTFTYFNEDDYDANGDRIAGATGVTFNANTLRIVKNAKNQYEFYDQSDDVNPIATIDVSASVIENITEILTNEDVVNQLFASISAKGKKIHSNDSSLSITGGEKAGLHDVIINIREGGVQTDHIANKAVTPQKINGTGVAKGAVLTADGLGNTKFETPTETVKPAMQGDLVGETDVILVDGGENVLFGDQTKQVVIGINEGGIVNKYLGQQSIKVEKFDATDEAEGAVATVNADGTVSYKPLTPAAITSKGDITTDNIITVDDGIGKVLGNVQLGIKDQSVVATKLDATGAPVGAVATVGADGKVTYKALEANAITDKGSITTDNIIKVDNGTDKVLGDVNLSIEAKSITAAQLADQTITNDQIALATITPDRISSANETPNKALVIDGTGNVKWGKIDDLVTDAAGNLTTDGVIELQQGDGVNALFDDVKLGIKDKSIQRSKLSSVDGTAVIERDMLLVTDGQGGFDFVEKEAVQAGGVDLNLGTALGFIDGTNGLNAVLAPMSLDVKDGGISTNKLANAAVTPAKINAVGAEENAVLTADGQGNVVYKKINETAFEGTEADLISDGSLNIPEDNKALLSELTIGIANSGVKNQHLSNQSVTVTKINSEAATDGTVLTADGTGHTTFRSLNEVALVQGQAVSSSDQSLAVPIGNKAALQALDLTIASAGVKTIHLADKNVTASKIGTNAPNGQVLTSNGQGGAEFKTLGQVIGNNGKAISSEPEITVVGGDHAALADVTLSITDEGVTEAKLANNAVTTSKINDKAITAEKIQGERVRTILITDEHGDVTWADANEQVIGDIIKHTESVTVLRDNNNGTFTYFNENEVNHLGQVKPGALGATFNANTLTIDKSTPGVFVFKDKGTTTPMATIDVRAKSIVFEGNSNIEYNNVEEAILGIINRIDALENLDIAKAPLKGQGILINGIASEADALFKEVELSIANEAVTTAKIKGGNAKQILITDDNGKAKWVDATDSIIEEIVQTQERITILKDQGNGTFIYYNEQDVDQQGNITGVGVQFNANTLRIDTIEAGTYVFYDKATADPLATINVSADVIEKITEILSDTNVQSTIYTTVANQGKNVTGDEAIQVTGGTKAVLNELSITLRDGGIKGSKIEDLAITEDKLYAGEGKESFVPVVQPDGSVKYQPMAAVVQGKALTVDTSLEVSTNAYKALLQPVELKIKEDGITSAHIQSHAVTTEKISAQGYAKGAVLTADGSGNTVFATKEDAISPAMQGDLVGEGGIAVLGGENVLFGNQEKQVKVQIKNGGVTGEHIAVGTIKNLNIGNQTIQSEKLDAREGEANRVAVANANGEVEYLTLSSELLTEKGKINTDGVITASENGVDKVLADVTLGVADTSIKPRKLHANGKTPGSVLTVGSNGVSVDYEVLSASKLGNKGKITTDGVVTVDNGVDKVLADVKLGIKNKGITTTQLADSAVKTAQLDDKSVTTAKISAEGITAASMLVTQGDGEVTWAELGNIVIETAGDLTTDSIIQITSGTGEKALLKDVELGIAEHSISKNKLSSIEDGVAVREDFILVTDGAGGFDYVFKEAVEAGGENLTLGSSLTFTNNSDGLNAVLAPTTIEVAPSGITGDKIAAGAVTVNKINAEAAVENSVLTANANGTVAFKELSATAFEGEGADLKSDGTILVATANKALLSETTISLAEEGVDSQHIKAKAVTTDKIASTIGNSNAGSGTVLTADGEGNAVYKTLESLATSQGKAVTSTDASIVVTPNNKAALQELNLAVAESGIKTKHLAARNVTVDKIGSDDIEGGAILVTDGQGGAVFTHLEEALSDAGKELSGGTGITISGPGAQHALLGDATVNISERGVGELQLADGAVVTKKLGVKSVTVDKLNSKVGTINTPSGQALVSDGSGGVKFGEVGSSSSGELKGSSSIEVGNGLGALLHDATVTIKAKGVDTAQLADNAVTNSQLAMDAVNADNIVNGAVNTTKIADLAVNNSKIANSTITGSKLINKAITTDKIDDSAVTTGKIQNSAVTNDKIQNGAVTAVKINAENATQGHVLTVESGGTVAFKAPIGGSSIEEKDLSGSETIEVENGEGAVLTDVVIKVRQYSITDNELAAEAVGEAELKNDAVGFNQLQADAVHGQILKDQGVTSDKISSVEDDEEVEEGYVLTADGDGGASFKPNSSNKAAMPKFFYAPSFYFDVVPGEEEGVIDVYEIYANQFGSPMAVNPGANGASLPVLAVDELNYFVLHYDDEILYDVEIDDDGWLSYSVSPYVQVKTGTYINIVFGVKE